MQTTVAAGSTKSGDSRPRHRSLVKPAAFLLLSFLLDPAAAYNPRGRRLRATAYGPMPTPTPEPEPTDFPPTFANRGGPPEISGVWQADSYAGIVQPSGFVSTIYKPDDNNEWMQQMGRWLSYSCTGLADGQYIAATLRRDTYSNGTIITKGRCEVGHIWLEEGGKGVYGWNSSESACPDPKTVEFNFLDYRVPNDAVPPIESYTCKKGGPEKAVDTFGVAGLEATEQSEVQEGPELPPPLDTNADFPPVLPNAGGPADIAGVWFPATKPGDAITIELVTDNGFSAVSQLPDEKLQSILGRFNSFNCSGPGQYVASFSYFFTEQDGSTASGAGCTAGEVDLEAETYSWTNAQSDGCPTWNGKGDATMGRANNSVALESATQPTCT